MNIRTATTESEIRACYPAMRELRPHLSEEVFVSQVQRQMQNHGYVLVYIAADGEVMAAAGYRVAEFLAWGKACYLDDLVIVPLGILLAIRLVPKELMEEFRAEADGRERRSSRAGRECFSRRAKSINIAALGCIWNRSTPSVPSKPRTERFSISLGSMPRHRQIRTNSPNTG